MIDSYGLRCWYGEPGSMPGAHAHNELELNLVVSGGLDYWFGGKRVRMEGGQLGIFWATVPHQLVGHEQGTRLHWITLPLVTFLGWNLPRRIVKTVLDGGFVLEQNDARLEAEALRWKEWTADLAAESEELRTIMLLELEARLRRTALRMNDVTAVQLGRSYEGELGRIEKMTAFVAQSYASPITVGDIASAAGLHPNYAMALFRREFGLSLGEFLKRYRLSHAQRLLATTDDGVLDIAFACGFGSASRFHAAFREGCGISPAAYRRDLRRQVEAVEV